MNMAKREGSEEDGDVVEGREVEESSDKSNQEEKEVSDEKDDQWIVDENMVSGFGKLSLIGRMFSKKRCNVNFISTVFSRMWKTEEKWEVKVYKHDKCSTYAGFSFGCEKDYAKVKSTLPWRFKGGLMILEEWPESGQWEDAALNAVPVKGEVDLDDRRLDAELETQSKAGMGRRESEGRRSTGRGEDRRVAEAKEEGVGELIDERKRKDEVALSGKKGNKEAEVDRKKEGGRIAEVAGVMGESSKLSYAFDLEETKKRQMLNQITTETIEKGTKISREKKRKVTGETQGAGSKEDGVRSFEEYRYNEELTKIVNSGFVEGRRSVSRETNPKTRKRISIKKIAREEGQKRRKEVPKGTTEEGKTRHILATIAGNGFLSWTFTGFYVNPNQSLRDDSWKLFRRIKDSVVGAWLCIAWCDDDECKDIVTTSWNSILSDGSTENLKNWDGDWDEKFIQSNFHSDDVNLILSLATSNKEVDDEIMWHYSKNGEYSIKSGKTSSNPSYNSYLHQTSHCLQSCLGNVGMKGMLGCTTGFCMPACGVVDWCILVDVDLQDQYTIQGKTKEKSRWSPPQVGVWKVNVDAGVYNMNGSCSSGVVIRDHSGQVLCSSSGFSSRPLSALPAESVAVISGLKLALAAGVKKNQVASDCLNAINLINNPSRSISDVDNLLEEITGLSCNFDLVEFRFELRDANLLAHSLAKLALKSKTSASWNRGVPLIV
ncbi:hypothetical protein F8388_003741 [Cannabis sativa]|uniref:RNase H type-1 domain-containing protein n=1 Tax=Cannabis sativa TaxID=3483 RepID=A0A7J6F713_CANSA|nr:hypothetical protein F8388_003741 [Cannabis sativa]